MESGDVTLRTESILRSRAIVSELLSSLDFEKGAGIAVDLSGIYKVMLGELVDVGTRKDIKTMNKLIGIASQLRDGFAGAAEQLNVKRSA